MRGKDDLFDETPSPARRAERGRGEAERGRGESGRGRSEAGSRGRRGRPEPARERWEGTLVDAARPVLEAALVLHRGGAGFDPTFAEFRRTTTNALEEFRIQARRTGIADEEIQYAEYALVAFVDELVSISSWAGKDQWDARPLEQERFNTTLAGTEFFDRVDRLRDAQRQALEVFYTCMTLGFEGGYRGDDARRQDLGAKIEALRRRLGVPAPAWDRPFFEEAYEPLRPTERAQRALGRLWLVLGVGSAGAFAIVYLVYWLLLLQKAGESASILSRG